MDCARLLFLLVAQLSLVTASFLFVVVFIATLCAEDEYVSSNACTACAAGSTNAAGDDATGSDTTCTGNESVNVILAALYHILMLIMAMFIVLYVCCSDSVQ
jgi:hypothetical protein